MAGSGSRAESATGRAPRRRRRPVDGGGRTSSGLVDDAGERLERQLLARAEVLAGERVRRVAFEVGARARLAGAVAAPAWFAGDEHAEALRAGWEAMGVALLGKRGLGSDGGRGEKS